MSERSQKLRKRRFRQIRAAIAALLLLCVIAFAFASCSGDDDKASAGDDGAAGGQKSEADLKAEKKAELKADIDAGLLVLVNKQHPVDSDYVPEDLAPVKYYAPDRNKNSRFMRAEAADHFHELVEAAQAENIDIVMTTAYRSYEFQQILWDNYVKEKGEEEANKTSARPGESEHQTGLAVDCSTSEIDNRNSQDFADTAAGRWVAENAYKYGFILRFPEGKSDITGYSYESWHLRYVGAAAAKDIYDNDLTLEEYVEEYDLNTALN